MADTCNFLLKAHKKIASLPKTQRTKSLLSKVGVIVTLLLRFFVCGHCLVIVYFLLPFHSRLKVLRLSNKKALIRRDTSPQITERAGIFFFYFHRDVDQFFSLPKNEKPNSIMDTERSRIKDYDIG